MKKTKIIQAGTSQVHSYLKYIYKYICTCKSGFQFLNSEHHVATGKFILPCLLVTELK